MRGYAGDIAQLARACDWQSQGQGFETPYLHEQAENKHPRQGVFCLGLCPERQ
jgi:hypothetical protein